MAKFIYKLQSLLNLKMQMEDSLKNELGKAVQKLEDEKKILVGIESDLEGSILQIYSKSSKGMRVEELKEYNYYISFLRERIESQKENINHAQNIVDTYREKLIKVVQERKMLDKLKQKKFQDYLAEQQKEDQKQNDEIVSYKFNNQAVGEENG